MTGRVVDPWVLVAVWSSHAVFMDDKDSSEAEAGGLTGEHGREVMLRHYEAFYRDTVVMLTEDSRGAIEVDSGSKRFGNSVVTVTAEPSPEELLSEIRRLREIALGTPQQAETAELTNVRRQLDRTRHQLKVMQDQFSYHTAFISDLRKTLRLEAQVSGALAPPEELLVEVRRLKRLDQAQASSAPDEG